MDRISEKKHKTFSEKNPPLVLFPHEHRDNILHACISWFPYTPYTAGSCRGCTLKQQQQQKLKLQKVWLSQQLQSWQMLPQQALPASDWLERLTHLSGIWIAKARVSKLASQFSQLRPKRHQVAQPLQVFLQQIPKTPGQLSYNHATKITVALHTYSWTL